MCTRSQRIFEAFRGDLGRGGRTSQVPEETIKAVGPETNDDILYFRYFFFWRRANARCQWHCQKVEPQVGKAGEHVELIPTGRKRRGTYVLFLSESVDFFHRAFSTCSLPADGQP